MLWILSEVVGFAEYLHSQAGSPRGLEPNPVDDAVA